MIEDGATLFGPPTEQEYIEEWVPRLQEMGERKELGSLSGTYVVDDVFIRRFDDGSWLAARTIDYEYAHLPDDEAVDITVFVDSEGAVYYVNDNHICTGELGESLRAASIEATSVGGVWAAIGDPAVANWRLSVWERAD